MPGLTAAPASVARASTLVLVACLCLFVLGGTLTLLYVPFPTAYDELQHLSFIHAMRDAPTLFPRYGTYHVLNADGHGWSAAGNYIAHPPLFYLLLAPFGDHVLLLRAFNLAMAVAGFTLCADAGVRCLPREGQRIAYLILLLMFSKPALIAGMINNDNLVLLETGLLFQLLVSPTKRPIAIGLVLALTGWTKFNAFVGLCFWVGLVHGAAIVRRSDKLTGRASVLLLAGVACGAVPTIINMATLGVAAYVPTDFLFIDPALRPTYEFDQFAAAFLHKIGQKILFVDGLADIMPVVGVMVLVAPFAAMALPRRERDLALAAWLATLGFGTIHVLYGWHSFRALGSMSDAQSRYYVMLWPGLALAAVLGSSALAERAVTLRNPNLRAESPERRSAGCAGENRA